MFGFLILLATTASLVAYLVCALAAIKLKAGRPALIPVFAVAALFSAWAIWGAGLEAIKLGAILLASGIPLYFLARRGKGDVEADVPA
jgi:APA family basic amino acid/polyamine antiporter